ncbi:nicotinate phosphoribosyltransferase family protein, partial [Kipferlia bialata]|eukprot:g10640.t1
MFGLAISGTHAHSFVSAFSGLSDLNSRAVAAPQTPSGTYVGKGEAEAESSVHSDFVGNVLRIRQQLGLTSTNPAELAAFIAYAQAGYTPRGIRLDSGDLAHLSNESRRQFKEAALALDMPVLAEGNIVASNDINEDVLKALNEQGHNITVFGIGTKLVTCSAQPALGCVFKLVELDGSPRIKLSQDKIKMTIPYKKRVFRLWGRSGYSVVDLMVKEGDTVPEPGSCVECYHPFDEQRRCKLYPTKVEDLHMDIMTDGRVVYTPPSTTESGTYCREQVRALRPDHT